MTPKYNINQWVYFIKIRNGIHIGYEPIYQINQTEKEIKYWIGHYVCAESDVFETADDLKAAFNFSIEKLLNTEPLF